MARPPKKTSDLKAFKKHRHANRLELKALPANTAPDCPGDYDAEHRAKWVEVCGHLVDFKILHRQDYDSIDTYVRLSFIAKKALAAYIAEPLINDRVNPAWRVYTDAEKSLSMLRDKFGFNPRARQGIKVEDPKEIPNDPFADFFNLAPETQGKKKTKPQA